MWIINMFQQNPAMATVYLLSFLLAMCVSISFHECAHAYVAYKLGDPTAKNLGRMSLDPMRHIDWWGALLFLLVGIGWAKPVIVSSRNLKNFKRDDVLIALAGPFINLLLSFIFAGFYYFVPSDIWWLHMVLYMLVSLNVQFAVFNILPLPPLDGFHLVTSFSTKNFFKIVRFLQKYGYILLVILLLTGVLPYVTGLVSDLLLDLYSKFYGLFV